MIATMSVSLLPHPTAAERGARRVRRARPSIYAQADCISAKLLTAPYRMTTRRNRRDPSRLDLSNQRRRQRHIIEFGSHGAAFLVCPREELQGLADRSRIRRLLVNKDKACARDWPTLRALLIREDQIIALRMRPVRIGRGRLEGLGAGCDHLARLV